MMHEKFLHDEKGVWIMSAFSSIKQIGKFYLLYVDEKESLDQLT